MAITLASGTTVQFASAYAAPLAFTTNAGSNAAEAVLLMASTTGLAAGDAVELTSAWGALTGRVVRLKTVTANTSVVLELVDTTSTSIYPQSAGNGTLRKVNTFTAISQLTQDIQISGGDQEFADGTFLEDRIRRQIPVVRSPITGQLKTFFDPALPWFPLLKALSDSSVPAAFRFVYPNNSRTLGNAYWSMLDVPTIEDRTLRNKIDMAYAALPITYAT
jgi:hypothetical protein